MAWGGTRRGAGRPRNPIKRIGRTIRLSDEEFLGNNVLETHKYI